MKYKRTPVTTKEIIKYIRLRISRFKESLEKKNEEEIKRNSQKIRRAELDKLLSIIWNDKIKEEIEKMRKYKYKK